MRKRKASIEAHFKSINEGKKIREKEVKKNTRLAENISSKFEREDEQNREERDEDLWVQERYRVGSRWSDPNSRWIEEPKSNPR